jgi:hypothetical protein
MGFFFSDSADKIQHKDLDKHLSKIDGLRQHEREYVKGLFNEHKSSGITKIEIDKAIRELKSNTSDGIDPQKAERIQDALHDQIDPDSDKTA